MTDSSRTLQDNIVQMAYMDMVDRQFAIAEMNYLISHGWRPCGFYQTPEGVWTTGLMWLPPPGYPTLEGKEHGVCTTHAVNSQRKQRR